MYLYTTKQIKNCKVKSIVENGNSINKLKTMKKYISELEKEILEKS